ncbi:hypothetical protein VP01_326g8 [Puccinia sorghi]|uniref:Uncharacterized protein n=1 Tax=Puccinia sorghi TaxID=27349 RepID=A0A0L6UZT3_9BASI|nr:hypothetical protein VP01_326g8 [Puccinia sorghi]
MDPWNQSNSSVPSAQISTEVHQNANTAALARTSQLEAIIASLSKEVHSLKGSSTPPPTKAKKKSTATQHTTPKQSTTQVNPGLSSPAATSTPKRQIRANSAPAEVGNCKPRKLAKNLKSLKVNALFVHIKILWGLLMQDAVPKVPDLGTLQEFHQQFSNTKQVKQAAQQTQSPSLINTNEDQLFPKAQAESIKFGRQLIHLCFSNIRYTEGLMVCLGLRVWCPNLDEDSASLYNAAHRIAALTCFQDLVPACAYDHMNIDPSQANNMALLIQAYDHYVHWVVFSKYQKKLKQTGKLAEEAEIKKISQNRERKLL